LCDAGGNRLISGGSGSSSSGGVDDAAPAPARLEMRSLAPICFGFINSDSTALVL